MKTLAAIFAALSLSAVISCIQTGTDNVNVIPHPEHVRLLGGYTAPGKCNISKTIDKNLEEEEYHIIIRDGDIRVSASAERGFLYADQTLSQLADTPEGYPNVIIHDKPRFKWRGMHLDCGRHFFSTDEVKRYLDIMAVHKMNTFHWHLTEDQGWRIEIKKHPELTRTGAWRFGNRLRTRTPQDKTRDLDLYGGYYTQDEMRAIVEYAAVMSWRGSDSGREAARLGHDAVMSPFSHMYLDYCQSMDRDSEPENIGGYLPVSKVYSYEPFTEDMTEEEKSHIIGVQANLWTEFISDAAHLEYIFAPTHERSCRSPVVPTMAKRQGQIHERHRKNDKAIRKNGLQLCSSCL